VSAAFKAPDFFVIGAQKAGTTTLHDRLVGCPLVNLPITKETHYFSDDANFEKGIEWYERQFPASEGFVKRGEIAPDYLFSKSAPARIHAVNPKPDIICLFRQPLERAYSNYLMAVRNGYEQLDFCDALLAEPERTRASPRERALYSYLGRSLYGEQLRHYFDHLPEARYRFLTFEDFTDEGELGRATFREICDFIGVAPCADEIDLAIKSNVASKPRSAFLRDQLYRPSPLKRLLRLLIPSQDIRARIAYRLDRLNQEPVKKTPMGKVPETVINRLMSDLALLEELTNLDLTHWKNSISSHNQGK
jgi:hypothetical protein